MSETSSAVDYGVDTSTTDRDTRSQYGSLGKVWRGSLTAPQLRTSASNFVQGMPEVALAISTDGWERVISFECSPEYVGEDYPWRDMRGKHFLTTTAMYMQENVGVCESDETGFGSTPVAPNCHETA